LTDIFLHIPKTAGSSLKSIVFSQYPRSKSFYIDGGNPNQSLSILKRDLAENHKHFDLIYGHIDYNSVDFLNNQNLNYVTILRNPTERVISLYYHIINMPNHYLHKRLINEKVTLKQFIQGGFTTETDNGQVRILAGAGGYHKNDFSKYNIPYGKVNESLLEEAINNINKSFVFVGVQEYFLESLILIKKYLNWKESLYVNKINTNKAKKNIDEVDQEMIELIRNYNSFDIKLYEYALNRFKRDVKKNFLFINKEKAILRLKDYKNRV